jgi:hypothetical protein
MSGGEEKAGAPFSTPPLFILAGRRFAAVPALAFLRDRKEFAMKSTRLDRAVARATGEQVRRISRMGFSAVFIIWRPPWWMRRDRRRKDGRCPKAS